MIASQSVKFKVKDQVEVDGESLCVPNGSGRSGIAWLALCADHHLKDSAEQILLDTKQCTFAHLQSAKANRDTQLTNDFSHLYFFFTFFIHSFRRQVWLARAADICIGQRCICLTTTAGQSSWK